jgi:hypothetical protein
MRARIRASQGAWRFSLSWRVARHTLATALLGPTREARLGQEVLGIVRCGPPDLHADLGSTEAGGLRARERLLSQLLGKNVQATPSIAEYHSTAEPCDTAVNLADRRSAR